ncbi:MAG TPA: hypothetical protein VEI02_15225 [Planctomycetota bacterium]|nr:hypothetical protein [Planctomycetota bacterium]
MTPRERSRLKGLLLALGASVAVAGVVRPIPRRASDLAHAADAEALDGVNDDGDGEAEGPASLDAESLLVRGGDSVRTPFAPPARDPFVPSTPPEAPRAIAGDADGAASRPAAAPPPVDPAELERIRALRLLGAVQGADRAAAVFEGVGRLRVGDPIPNSSFVLREVRGRRVALASGAVVVELSLPDPQGGSARSEK